MTDKEKKRLKDKFKAYETGQAWIYLQKKALLKAMDEDQPTGVWAKVAMECERKHKECQNELKKMIKEDSTKKP